MKNITLLMLGAVFIVAIACSGGGGSSPSASTLSVRLKPAEVLPVEEGSTFLIKELGAEKNVILERTPLTGDPNQGVDVELEPDKSYVLIMEVNELPFLRTTLLASQIREAQESGILNIGSINAITTYLTGLLEVEINQGRQAAKTDINQIVANKLKELFGDTVADFSSLSYDNLENGKVTFTESFTQQMNRINMMRVYFHAVRNLDSNVTESQKNAVELLYTAIFDETDSNQLLNHLNSSELPLVNGQSFTDIANTLSSQGVFFEGSPEDQILSFLRTTDEGAVSGVITGMAKAGVEVNLTREDGTSLNKASTDSEGKFSFSGVEAGAYTITPTLEGHIFDPPQQTLTLEKSQLNKTDLSFTSIVDQGSVEVTPGSSDATLAEGYYASVIVKGAGNLLPSNILSGVELFGVQGTAAPLQTGGNATSSDLLAGRTAYVGGALITGTAEEKQDNKILYTGTSSGGNIQVKYE